MSRGRCDNKLFWGFLEAPIRRSKLPLLALALLLAIASPLATPAALGAEAAAPGGDRATALTATVVLKVVHPDRARAELVEAAATLGGFPVPGPFDRFAKVEADLATALETFRPGE